MEDIDPSTIPDLDNHYNLIRILVHELCRYKRKVSTALREEALKSARTPNDWPVS